MAGAVGNNSRANRLIQASTGLLIYDTLKMHIFKKKDSFLDMC